MLHGGLVVRESSKPQSDSEPFHLEFAYSPPICLGFFQVPSNRCDEKWVKSWSDGHILETKPSGFTAKRDNSVRRHAVPHSADYQEMRARVQWSKY